MSTGLRVGELFAGIGGLGLGIAATWPGASTAWVAENDPHSSRVLASQLRQVPNLGDVTALDWSTVPAVDVVAGGFPCQDVSRAGRRAGLTAGTRSGLWSVMRDAIAVLKPRIVVIENTEGLNHAPGPVRDSRSIPCFLGEHHYPPMRALASVLADLAQLGFDASWRTVPAAHIGAPHLRHRVFILATAATAPHPSSPRRQRTLRPERPVQPHPAHHFAWAEYAPAIQRWEQVTGTAAPQPTDDQHRVRPEFVEWVMGYPIGWTQPAGAKTHRLRALGNAVIPEHAAHTLRQLTHDLTTTHTKEAA